MRKECPHVFLRLLSAKFGRRSFTVEAAEIDVIIIVKTPRCETRCHNHHQDTTLRDQVSKSPSICFPAWKIQMVQASFETGTSRFRVLRSAVAPHWLGK